jgi:hypothetical protein
VNRFESDVMLRDCSLTHVQLLRSEDRALLMSFIRTLSSETLYLRFLDVLKPEEAGKN